MSAFQCISAELYPGNGEPVEIRIDTLDHEAGVAKLCAGFPIKPSDWPDGYGVSNEFVTLSTHQGTHVDAPRHYHPEGADITEADVNDFIGQAVMFRDTGHAPHDFDYEWDSYLSRLDHYSGRAKAAFFITGAYRRYGDENYFHDFKGVPLRFVEAALDRNYKIIGTDAFSLDPPFAVMSRAFVETGDKSVLWPTHVLGRVRPYYQIERLCHLQDFETARLIEFIALPVKLRCGAAWTRAVARIVE